MMDSQLAKRDHWRVVMQDAEHQKEAVQGFPPDNDECDIDIMDVALGTQWFGIDPYKLERGNS